MANCLACLGVIRGRRRYHPKCLRSLFGTDLAPVVDFDLAELNTIALQMAGRMSISGVQRKVSVRPSADGSRIEPAAEKGLYILKPQGSFPNLPENEHVTMKMAGIVGIQTPPCGLVQLKDSSYAYLIRRFDRLDSGEKLRQEDFCQLARKPPQDKYGGSAELCVRLLREYATEPLIEIRRLYQLLLFSWWVFNGDMHLKNFSLLTGEDGRHRLSPAYDQVCTRLVIPTDDRLALPMGGRDRSVTRRQWLDFARYGSLPERAAESLLERQRRALSPSIELIKRSYLPESSREQYLEFLGETSSALEPR